MAASEFPDVSRPVAKTPRPSRSLSDVEVVPLRHWGRVLAAAVALLVTAALIRAFARAQIDWSVVRQFLTMHAIFVAFTHTLLITACAMLLGLALGIVFATMRLSRNPVTSSIAWVYVWFFRGTPVLLQLLLWFNLSVVFPKLGFPGLGSVATISVITPFVAALLGLGVNEGAYLTEVIRAGIQSVDEGQEEAAAALGLSRGQTLRTIVLPQAMRVIIPPVGNETIGMLKTSSLAAVISYGELLQQSQKIYFVNGRVMELLIVAGAWYLLATSVLSTGQYYLERHMARGLQRARPRSSIERLVIGLLDRRRRRREQKGAR